MQILTKRYVLKTSNKNGLHWISLMIVEFNQSTWGTLANPIQEGPFAYTKSPPANTSSMQDNCLAIPQVLSKYSGDATVDSLKGEIDLNDNVGWLVR